MGKVAINAPNSGPEFYNTVIEKLVENGEDKTLGIALHICAFKNIVLDPATLGRAFRVVDDKFDIIPCCALQSSKFLKIIYALAEDKHILYPDRVLAALIATELTVKLKKNSQTLEKILLKLDNSTADDFFKDILSRCSKLLLDPENTTIPLLFNQSPLAGLPEEKPPLTVGGGFTVQRPVPKISRNAPCHCGSGKKYKKCCFEKDQELLRDPSPYKGLTMTEVKKAPGLVEDAELIKEMPPHELQKLVPAELNPEQLFIAYRACHLYSLYEQALNMLVELRSRPNKKEFAEGHMEDLFDSALDNFDINLADRISQIVPFDTLTASELTKLEYKIVKRHKNLAALDKFCRLGITKSNLHPSEHPFLQLAFLFEHKYPGLAIVFARTALISESDRFFDNDLLVDTIFNCRVDLDQDPWDDPAVSYYNSVSSDYDELEEKDEQINELACQLKQARKTIADKTQELKIREKELDKLVAQQSTAPVSKTNTPESDNEKKELAEKIQKLRRNVKNMQVELRNQQEERLSLRRQLEETRQENESPKEPTFREQAEKPIDYAELPKKILVPEYSDQFIKQCEKLEPAVAAKALQQAAGFAAHDRAVWKQTVPMTAVSHLYRIRVGINYRLILEWQPGQRIRVLALIPREDLSNWIKKYKNS